MDFKIDVYNLNQTKGGTDFSSNDRAEVLVTNAFCYMYGLDNNGGTSGFNPDYDRTINNTTVEIKISKNENMFIEIGKADGEESGITISKADVHMYINPGATKINGKWVDLMKVRLFNTQDLRNWTAHMAKSRENELVVFKPSKLGKGSAGFFLNVKKEKVADLFVMGFEYHTNSQGHIVFDTSRIVMPDNTYAANNIRK